MLGHVEGPPGHHRRHRRAPDPSPRSPPATASHRVLGLRAPGPLPSRGRDRLRAPLPAARRPHRAPPRPRPSSWSCGCARNSLEAGHDAGADTIALAPDPPPPASTLSRATVHRILTRTAPITPEPKKRPKSSYIRFEAAMPNETWQSDFTHYRLTRRRRPTRHRRGDHHLARRLHPLRPAHHRPPPGHHPDRHGHLPRNRRSARHPCLHTDRQRHGLHRPTGRPSDAAAAATDSSSSCATGTWSRRTPAPTTPPPAARSSASSRP